jgi:hypothetical protein
MSFLRKIVSRSQKEIVILLTSFIPAVCSSQTLMPSGSNMNNSITSIMSGNHLKRGNISLEVVASLLPKAKIIKTKGSYKLQSHLQSAYDLGINYLYNVDKTIKITSGVHFVLGKRNYFLDVPNEDVSAYTTDGRKIIEGKELWGAFRIPILIQKLIKQKKTTEFFLKAGVNIRYSGLMSDLRVEGGGFLFPNGQRIQIFSGSFFGKNNYKPWLTVLLGGGKDFFLKNKNIFSICLQADISGTYFYTGTYEITIPNKPISTGTYKINGTSLGLSVQYIFTGYNKRLVKSYQKKAF